MLEVIGNYIAVTYEKLRRGKTIQVNSVSYIVFECIAIYCPIAICDWIVVKRHFIWEYGI